VESIKEFIVGQKQENQQREENKVRISLNQLKFFLEFPEFLGEVG